MRHLVLPAINVFILKDSKVLLGRRINTGWSDGSLCPFGGHIEKDESPTNAMIREIQEELGVTVQADDLEFACIAARHSGEVEYSSYEFIIRDKEYNFYNAEPHKCSQLVWAELHALPADIVEDFRIIIERSVIGKDRLVELGY